jgi:hypothetical protein
MATLSNIGRHNCNIRRHWAPDYRPNLHILFRPDFTFSKNHISFPLRQETLKLCINTNFKVLFLVMSIILSSELIFCHVVARDPHVTSSCKGPINLVWVLRMSTEASFMHIVFQFHILVYFLKRQKMKEIILKGMVTWSEIGQHLLR